jgi:DNA-directed RNA polymerase subunit L
MNRIQSVSTNKGKQTNRYDSATPIEMVAHFDIKWKDTQVEVLEQTIESIQEKLDTFNHTTEI